MILKCVPKGWWLQVNGDCEYQLVYSTPNKSSSQRGTPAPDLGRQS